MTAVLPSTGDANWQNLVDNWTEGDAEFLQDRLIQRVTNASDFTLASLVGTTPGTGNVVSSVVAGRTFYNTVTKNLVVSTTGTNAGLKALLASSSVKVVDTGTNAEILLTSGATGSGITFAPTGITIGGPVTFTGTAAHAAITGTDITGSGFLSVRAGSSSGLLVTDATSVKLNTTALADTSAAVRIATATGNLLNLNSASGGNASLALGGSISAGSITSSGALSGTSLSVGTVTSTANNLTNVTITGTTNTAAITASGTVTAANLTTTGTVTGGALTVSGAVNFAAIPVGPVADPTNANQLTRKAYVDAQINASAANRASYETGTFNTSSGKITDFDQNAWFNLVVTPFITIGSGDRFRVTVNLAGIGTGFGSPSCYVDARLVRRISGVDAVLSGGEQVIPLLNSTIKFPISMTSYDLSPPAGSSAQYILEVKCQSAVLCSAYGPGLIAVENIGV